MLDIATLGPLIATHRKQLGLRQLDLARQAGVSRSTIDSLENGRLGELGFGKIARILRGLGLELRIGDANQGRPTLEDLQRENAHDQSLDR